MGNLGYLLAVNAAFQNMRKEKVKTSAISAVAQACFIARAVQSKLFAWIGWFRSDGTPVTVADFAVQAYIVALLHREFPTHKFMAQDFREPLKKDPLLINDVLRTVNRNADRFNIPLLTREEIVAAMELCTHKGGTEEDKQENQYTWMLGGIDGSRGYIKRRQYCISLALVHQGKPVLGVLGCPKLPFDLKYSKATGTIFYASAGCGTFMLSENAVYKAVHCNRNLNNLGIRVRTSLETETKRAAMVESVEKSQNSREKSESVAKLLGIVTRPMCMDSQAKYGCISRGEAHIFLKFSGRRHTANTWAHAAGAIVIEEAGGKVTDGLGNPLDFSKGRLLDTNGAIVATNGPIHAQVVEAIQKTLYDNKKTR